MKRQVCSLDCRINLLIMMVYVSDTFSQLISVYGLLSGSVGAIHAQVRHIVCSPSAELYVPRFEVSRRLDAHKPQASQVVVLDDEDRLSCREVQPSITQPFVICRSESASPIPGPSEHRRLRVVNGPASSGSISGCPSRGELNSDLLVDDVLRCHRQSSSMASAIA